MGEYLAIHGNFAFWSALYLGVGLLVTAIWCWRFRRLATTAIASDELRWEAWRGTIGGLAWLAALGAIFLVMAATYELQAGEEIAVAAEITDQLLSCIAWKRRLIVPAAVLTIAAATGALVLGGRWSGAYGALHGEGRRG